MKRIYLLFFYLLCIGYRLQAQELDPYQFFSANVGDRWEYTLAGPNQIYTVIRDSIDQKDSSRFIFYNPPSNYGARYRIDRHYNVFMDPQLGSWWHLYKLDAKIGETWVAVAKTWAEKVVDVSQVYVFGKLTTVKTIGFFRLTLGDTVITPNSIFMYWQKLAYGFGMISDEDGATQPYLLRGCRINGVTYGTVDVEEESAPIPSEFVLHQNYPNPFNPSSVISYQLPIAGHIVLRVFDILGREIATLVNEEKQAGKYKVKFDGSGLVSGIYFYQLITNKTTRTMKMILQK